MARDEEECEKAKIKWESLDGFPKIAEFIAKDPDKAAAIFKRFDPVSYRNLLYLQSKVAVLQKRQAAFDEEDAKEESKERSDEAVRCATSWEDFEIKGKAAANGSEPDTLQEDARQQKRWKLSEDIQIAVKEYRKFAVSIPNRS